MEHTKIKAYWPEARNKVSRAADRRWGGRTMTSAPTTKRSHCMALVCRASAAGARRGPPAASWHEHNQEIPFSAFDYGIGALIVSMQGNSIPAKPSAHGGFVRNASRCQRLRDTT